MTRNGLERRTEGSNMDEEEIGTASILTADNTVTLQASSTKEDRMAEEII